MKVIELINLHFEYKKNNVILNNLNLEVEKGCIYGYLGKNGAGKTTTIKILLQLLKPKSGEVRLFSENVFKNKMFKKIGALIESPSFYSHLNAYDNLKIYCYYRKTPFTRINEVCKIVNLDASSNKKCGQYSTGMKQRLGLAIALLDNPELLILDEPINGLDPSSIIEFRDLLIKINYDFGTTIFFSSHQLSEVEKICTDIGIINKGKLVIQGNLKNILANADSNRNVYIDTNDISEFNEVLKTNGFNIISSNKISMKYNSKETYASNLKFLSDRAIEMFNIRIDKTNIEDIYLKNTKL